MVLPCSAGTANLVAPKPNVHEVEHVLGSWVIYARNFLNFEPHDAVWFEHEPPADPALLADYAEVFGCEVSI